MIINAEDAGEDVLLLGEKLKKGRTPANTQHSRMSSDGTRDQEIGRKIGRRNWKNVSGVLCDKKMSENEGETIQDG